VFTHCPPHCPLRCTFPQCPLTSALSILRVEVACSSPLALASVMTVSEVSSRGQQHGESCPPRAGSAHQGTPVRYDHENADLAMPTWLDQHGAAH